MDRRLKTPIQWMAQLVERWGTKIQRSWVKIPLRSISSDLDYTPIRCLGVIRTSNSIPRGITWHLNAKSQAHPNLPCGVPKYSYLDTHNVHMSLVVAVLGVKEWRQTFVRGKVSCSWPPTLRKKPTYPEVAEILMPYDWIAQLVERWSTTPNGRSFWTSTNHRCLL